MEISYLQTGRWVAELWLWTPRSLRSPRWTPPRLTAPSLWWPWPERWSSHPPDRQSLRVTSTVASGLKRALCTSINAALIGDNILNLSRHIHAVLRGSVHSRLHSGHVIGIVRKRVAWRATVATVECSNTWNTVPRAKTELHSHSILK